MTLGHISVAEDSLSGKTQVISALGNIVNIELVATVTYEPPAYNAGNIEFYETVSEFKPWLMLAVFGG